MAVTNKVTKNEQALLEDDDDFEEFPTEGKGTLTMLSSCENIMSLQTGRQLMKIQRIHKCGRTIGTMTM